jgi:hypothetical protein
MDTMWVDKLMEKDGEWQWVPEQETYDTATDFTMDEGNLNQEICRMGQLMVKYGDLAARQSANLKRKEENVKYVQASTAGAIRSTSEADGTKLTEGKLNEKVTVNAYYQKALSELHILRVDALKADHWWRSILKKGDLLNAMAFRQNAEIKRMPG